MRTRPWHIPVLATATLDQLALTGVLTVVDCTTGGGGHSRMILERLEPGSTLVVMDKDSDAFDEALPDLTRIAMARGITLIPIRADFRTLTCALETQGIARVDRILADIGVSSHQLDHADRGFSYQHDGPLDMRMDPQQGVSAAQVVNTWSEDALSQIIRDFGEERYHGRIARAISTRRASKPFQTTLDLADTVRAAMPARARHEAQHPAKRTFQALRIAVNGELEALDQLLKQAPEVLNPEGRLLIITFHSLEDRPVKQAMRQWEHPCTCPPGLPCVCGKTPLGHSVRRSGTVADAQELEANPRSRSARLRTFIFDEMGPTGSDSDDIEI